MYISIAYMFCMSIEYNLKILKNLFVTEKFSSPITLRKNLRWSRSCNYFFPLFTVSWDFSSSLILSPFPAMTVYIYIIEQLCYMLMLINSPCLTGILICLFLIKKSHSCFSQHRYVELTRNKRAHNLQSATIDTAPSSQCQMFIHSSQLPKLASQFS